MEKDKIKDIKIPLIFSEKVCMLLLLGKTIKAKAGRRNLFLSLI
jgi:hypothetical protein